MQTPRTKERHLLHFAPQQPIDPLSSIKFPLAFIQAKAIENIFLCQCTFIPISEKLRPDGT
jgi:hypothetical protein